MLDCPKVSPERRQRVPGVRRQLLPDADVVLRKVPRGAAELHRLVAQGVARPFDSWSEELGWHVRQEVPRDGQQHVRGEVWVLAGLVVPQVLGPRHAEAPPAELFAGQLAGNWHERDCALEGALDLLEDFLDVLGQVPPPGVDVVPHVGRRAPEGDEHGARPLVGLTLLALHEDHRLVLAVPTVVALDDASCRLLELVPQDLFAPDADLLQLLVQQQFDIKLRLEAAPVALNHHHGRPHLLDESPGGEAAQVGLRVGRILVRLLEVQAPQGSPDHALLPPGGLALVLHGAAAVQVAAVGGLDGHGRRAQHGVAAPSQQPPEGRLEARRGVHHAPELHPRHHAPPNGLNTRDADFELLLLLLGGVLAVPALEQGRVPAVVAVDLLHVPHGLALLDHDGGLRLPADLPARQGAPDVLLQQGDRLLLVGLRHDVGVVVCNDVRGEVVVVPLHAGRETRRLQPLHVPVLLWRLRQRGLERIRAEEEPIIAVPGAVLVRLVVPGEEAAAVREANVQQRDVVREACGL
mmetsp:Transcript_31899/g.83689  ORF Transcript_31899/g.83689 Transcript_31899/m.83689 type:complete len:522 (-) Transcript_31899:1771-3336(-)